MQTDILETMGPLSFASFRNYLGKSSGFQSAQFREFEFLLGFKEKRFLDHAFFSNEEKRRLSLKFSAPSIWEKFTSYFIEVTKNSQVGELEHADFKSLSQIHRVLIYIYRNHSIYTEIAELIVDIDEGLQEWRYRHVKMVERTIGDKKSGTGGSSGLDYLKQSLFKSFCPELLEIRNYLN
jgi:tryptophan 2,3-dioxygenase